MLRARYIGQRATRNKEHYCLILTFLLKSGLFPYHFLKLEMSFPGAEGRFMAVAVPNRDAVEGPSTIEKAEAPTAAKTG